MGTLKGTTANGTKRELDLHREGDQVNLRIHSPGKANGWDIQVEPAALQEAVRGVGVPPDQGGTTFDQVVEAVKALNPAEQCRLRDVLDGLLRPSGPVPTEDEFELELLREGIISEIPPPITDFDARDDWEPIEIQGKPLSETIIEERR